jgi:pimeloyl-ACP methyl ester carboxylesterase
VNIYFISGLGADKRIFRKLKLPEFFNIHYIEWVSVREEESLESYCNRLSEQIDQTKPFTLIGISFGGMIAIELSKKLKPIQTIIISSFCCKKEVSKFYIFLGKTGLMRLIPTGILLQPNRIVYWLFGANNSDERQLLKNILRDTDPHFYRWAVKQLFSWDNSWKPEGLIHIHGTADKIIPFSTKMDAIPVEGGEHLMVYSKAEIVNDLLKQNLQYVLV